METEVRATIPSFPLCSCSRTSASGKRPMVVCVASIFVFLSLLRSAEDLLLPALGGEAKTGVRPTTYIIPPDKAPDPVTNQRLMAAFPPGPADRDLGRQALSHCNATALIQIQRWDLDHTQVNHKHNPVLWTLHTFDLHGELKHVGGDEFYITFTADGHSPSEPTAIANITDWNNGTYSFHFVSSPTAPTNQSTNNTQPIQSNSTGALKIFLEQSCGAGRLAPPLKNNWTTSGAIGAVYTIPNVTAPKYVQQFIPPNQDNAIDLGAFHYAVVVGDSLLGQLVCAENNIPSLDRCKTFRPKTFRGYPVQAALNTQTVANPFLSTINAHLQHTIQHATKTVGFSLEELRLALVIGSGVWDVLADDQAAGGQDFNNHLTAIEQLIGSIRHSHPKVTILWKSMTAFHLHEVATQPGWEKIKRSYYMSQSRARHLDQLQKALLKTLSVPVLDVFDATHYAAHKARVRDGRHYKADFNELSLGWFYPESNSSSSSG